MIMVVHEKTGIGLPWKTWKTYLYLYIFLLLAETAAILLCPAVFVSSQYWLALGLSSVLFCFIFKDVSEGIKSNSEAAVFVVVCVLCIKCKY